MAFTPDEENYISQQSRQERVKLHNMLTTHASRDTSVPRRVRLLKSGLDTDLKISLFAKLANDMDPKFTNWVEQALKLPIGRYTPMPPRKTASAMLHTARRIMDAEITGHTPAKHEVLRILSNFVNGGGQAGFALGLEGPAGVGKTSFAKHALARGLNRPFCFISLGGASDASMLLGHSYTYEGAIPGKLTDCLTASKVMDPVFFFDELDKISTHPKGQELVHALIHLTDPVQNDHITDRYFQGINLDLSRAIFVFSYNDATRVNPILLDRIRRISMSSPSPTERLQICTKHIIPRALAKSNCNVEIQDAVVNFIITRNKQDAGMRGVEKDIDLLVSSSALIETYGSTDILGVQTSARVPDRRSRGRGPLIDLAFASQLFPADDVQKPHLAMYL